LAPCRIIEVVNEVCATLSVLAAERTISVVIRDMDRLPVIQADETRLYNAMYNLVNNAIPEIGPGGSITVSGRVDRGGIIVSVADTGKGMRTDVRESLFTHAVISTKRSGSGIGMKIIKDAVDAHHGRIWVESEVGKGTTFQIWLPYDPGSADART
jgi:signal transduction histidine kinase